VTVTAWEPRTVTDEAVVEPGPVTALQSLLDDGLTSLGAGDPLPPLWHWVALPQWSPSGLLGDDGHPRRGSFLPPVPLPRRMFAGGRVRILAPLGIGSTVRRESVVTDVVEKQGRSGSFVVVDVATRLHNQDGDLAVDESQTIVYRAADSARPAGDGQTRLADAARMKPVGPPLVRRRSWEWSLTTDPTLLMRFSAATANAHRIHYDWPYATEVEGYPGLVVHGPLLSLALAEVARLEGVAGITGLSHRNLAPLFCGTTATVTRADANPDGGTTLTLAAQDTPCTSLTFWTTDERQHS
jgi:3-methylfumaryl-CoA hydratase